MHVRAIAVIVHFLLPAATNAQTTEAVLSPSDCALLLSEYGVTSPGCSAPPSEAVAQRDFPLVEPVVAEPVLRLSTAIRESHVFFPSGGAVLDTAATAKLQEIVKLLSRPELDDTCLLLIGHSDLSGSVALNQAISLQRSEAVAAFLAPLLGTNRIDEVAARGPEEPLAGILPTAHENRRVAIYLRRCK